MYQRYVKRILDFVLSFCVIIVLSPVLIVLTIVGAFEMKGNPFFTQERPGWHEQIFRLVKFRSMNMAKDRDGKLLPDVQRITKYGRFIRHTSLDELPELFNIVKGDMSIIGPRPLLVKYLPLYNDEQRHRHDVRPGLTGYAQVHGRNCTTWEQRLSLDVKYTKNVTFRNDVNIFIDTIKSVIRHEGINSEATTQFTMEEFTGEKGK